MDGVSVSDLAGMLPVPFAATDSRGEDPLHTWLRSVLAAEFESRGPQRTLKNGDRFSEAWPSLAALVMQWPIDSAGDMRDANLMESAAQVHTILARWEASGEDVSDHVVLDSIRVEIDGTSPTKANSSPVVQPRSLSSVAASLVRDTENGQAARDCLAHHVQALEDEASVLVECLAENSEALSAARASAEDAQRALIQKIEQVDELTHRLATKSRRVDELSALIAQSQAEVAALRRESAAEPLLAAAKADALALRDQLATASSRLRQRDEELAQVWAEMEQLRAALMDKDEVVAAHAIEIEKLSGKLAESEAWVFKLAGERRSRDDALVVAQARLKRALIDHDRAQEALERERGAHASALEVQRDLRASIERAQFLPAHTDDQPSDQSEPQILEEALEERDLAVSLLTAMVARVEAAELASMTSQHKLDDARRELETLMRTGAGRELERQLSEARAEARNLARELLDARAEAQENAQQLAHLADVRAEAQNLAQELLAVRAQAQENAQQLAEATAQSEELRASAEWIRQVSLATRHRRWWWSLLPASYARRKVLKRLHRHGLFDGDAYLQLYPDVKSSGMSPLYHYLNFGIMEGRQRPR